MKLRRDKKCRAHEKTQKIKQDIQIKNKSGTVFKFYETFLVCFQTNSIRCQNLCVQVSTIKIPFTFL